MTWLDLPAGTGFGLDNLPYGVFSTPGTAPRTGVAIGDSVLDLAAATGDDVHATGSLNAFMARGPQAWAEMRAQLTEWFTGEAHRSTVEPHLVPRSEVTLHLPVEVADRHTRATLRGGGGEDAVGQVAEPEPGVRGQIEPALCVRGHAGIRSEEGSRPRATRSSTGSSTLQVPKEVNSARARPER